MTKGGIVHVLFWDQCFIFSDQCICLFLFSHGGIGLLRGEENEQILCEEAHEGLYKLLVVSGASQGEGTWYLIPCQLSVPWGLGHLLCGHAFLMDLMAGVPCSGPWATAGTCGSCGAVPVSGLWESA